MITIFVIVKRELGGALSNLGVETNVIAEITSLGLPSVSFQVKVDAS